MPIAPTKLHERLSQAVALHRAGKLFDAERVYREVLADDPENFDALHLCGTVCVQAHRPLVGIALIRKALTVRPDEAAALANLALGLRDLGRYDEALAACDRAIVLLPNQPAFHANRAALLTLAGRGKEARAALEMAASFDPNSPVSLKRRARETEEAGQREAALGLLDRAIALQPFDPDAYFHRAALLLSLGRAKESEAALTMVVRQNPRHFPALLSRATILAARGDIDEALAAHDAAIACAPESAEAHVRKAVTLLRAGRYSEGLRLFEWRKRLDPAAAGPLLDPKSWTGEVPIAGRRLLLHAELGLGDTLQFCRYAPMACDRGAQVVMQVQAPLVSLLRGLDPRVKVIGPQDNVPAFDLHAPLLSLPLAFATTVETIPAAVPYLHAETGRVQRWRARLSGLPGRKLGVFWTGGPIPPALLGLPGVSLVWLGKGQAVPPPLHDWSAEFEDASDTAGLVAALDLVISVDADVLHLAGSLARPVWLLDSFDHNWRWLTGREDSPWYPTLRIFRQTAPGDWAGVMRRLVAALQAEA